MSYFAERYIYPHTTVTAQAYNRKISVELSLDATIDEVLDAFKTIALGMTFHETSWKNAIIELAHEYLDEEKRLDNSLDEEKQYEISNP